MPGLCPIHGPYDGEECPYEPGSRSRPPGPPSLEDDHPTDVGASAPRAYGVPEEDLPTDLGGYGAGGSPGRNDPDITDLPAERRAAGAGGRGWDFDEELSTELGRSRVGDKTEIENVLTGILGILWVKQGHRRGQIYHIKDGTKVGRTKGSLILDDPKVSEEHARFRIENKEFVMWDFGSSNGTFVNGERIRAATVLKENDEIKIGDMVFVLKMLPE